MHFANWLGGIKEQQVFVVSMTKRHYLYTGSGYSSNEGGLVADEYGDFQLPGYDAAFEVVSAREGDTWSYLELFLFSPVMDVRYQHTVSVKSPVYQYYGKEAHCKAYTDVP